MLAIVEGAVVMAGTHFRRWRLEMEMTQDQAAQALGVSVSQVKNWDAGQDRARGTPAAPPLAVRIVMRALSDGLTLKPWPE